MLVVYDGAAAVHHAKHTLRPGYDVHRDDPAWVVLERTDRTPGVVVHLRPRGPEAWREQVLFREFLRDDPTARRTYERAIQAAAHPDDVAAYTDAKAPAIAWLLDRARQAGYDERLPPLEAPDYS